MKVYFETLGCPKNFNDTQAARGTLKEYKGRTSFEMVESPDESDVIIVNTCGFINDAKRESIERIFDMAQYKDDGKRLVVSGCLSERYSEELKDEMPEVDCFIGVNEYDSLPAILEGLEEDHERTVVTGKYCEVIPLPVRDLPDNPYSQTLRIAEGCDNRCAYCVIPDIRGGFRSKRKEDVIKEAGFLAGNGCKELILIAQDVTNYGKDIYGKYALADLLKELVKVDGIEWIRLMYCYEDRITDELIEVMATEPKICHYIDIPVQHASDKVLRDMRRRSTSDSIRNTIAGLRNAMPDIAIRTTFIVGFPGETDDDYEELLDFIEETGFARLGVFAYSQEEGTPAGDMQDQIDEDIKQARLDEIMRTQLEISYENNKAMIGRTLKVLVDDRDVDGSYIGRTMYDAPEIDNSVLFTSERELRPGDFAEVVINDAFDYDLVGYEKR